ncbi:MAG: hypothetical protein GOU97_04305 [Nanoarchaeota archaeon]|nr:hypothetical protein [Nanoarchaeota archaeon]
MTNQNTINVNGMSCKKCAEKIESKLSSLKGIKKVEVKLVDDQVLVEYDRDKITLAEIKSIIEKLGYSTSRKKTITIKKNVLEGIAYGLVPHIGCIAFIIGSVLGVTVLMEFFKPLLMNRYFFHVLMAISFVFATISSFFYLKKKGFLSWKGVAKKWKYLTGMYGSTIGINLILFMVIFPLLANLPASQSITGAVVGVPSSARSTLKLSVDIPCPGHAPLISNELKTINGVAGVQFSFPNVFDVTYDSTRTSKQGILALEIFETYPATFLGLESGLTGSVVAVTAPQTSGGCGCGGSTCGGSAGSCCGGG